MMNLYPIYYQNIEKSQIVFMSFVNYTSQMYPELSSSF
jgi:hypothetical protein